MLRSLTIAAAILLLPISAGAQTSRTAYQWTAIPESMRDLVGKGYTVTAVYGQSVSGGSINTFYLAGPNDLVRCGEAYGVARLRPRVFPCERLIQPHE
jgi:hypothetical protein